MFKQFLNQNDSPCSFVFCFLPLLPLSLDTNRFQIILNRVKPPDFHLPSGFPRNTFFAVQYYIYFNVLTHTSHTIKIIIFLYHSSSASPALLIVCHMLYISVLNFLFSRPGSPSTINLHCVCFTGSLSGVLIKFCSTSLIGSIPNTRTVHSVTIWRKIVKL